MATRPPLPYLLPVLLWKRLQSLKFIRWVYYEHELLILRYPLSNPLPLDDSADIHVNRWEDAELFEQTERWLTKKAFIEETASRRNQGLRLYTVLSGNRLAYYSWVVPHQERAWLPAVGQHYEFPPGTDVIFNAYTHPLDRRKGIHKRVLKRQVCDAANHPNTSYVFIAVDPNNEPARLAVETIGFKPYILFFEKKICGNLTRGTHLVANNSLP